MSQRLTVMMSNQVGLFVSPFYNNLLLFLRIWWPLLKQLTSKISKIKTKKPKWLNQRWSRSTQGSKALAIRKIKQCSSSKCVKVKRL